MKDYIVRAIAADGAIRAFAVTSQNTVEEAKNRHNTSPIVTAALGRLMAGAAMMGVMMKGDDDVLTLQIRSEGPMRGMTVTADAKGNVKGYPFVPDVMLPANEEGKLDVGGAVGMGSLTVIKDMGLKEPYSGQIELISGEIAEDLTYYFAVSEQVPSAVGLGVLMNKDNTVRRAGGFIIQLMPFASEEIIRSLEIKMAIMKPVTTLLDEGLTPEQILDDLLGEFGLDITDKIETEFKCNCSREKVEQVISSISNEDFAEILNDGKPIEVKCDFCNTAYELSIEELKAIKGIE